MTCWALRANFKLAVWEISLHICHTLVQHIMYDMRVHLRTNLEKVENRLEQ